MLDLVLVGLIVFAIGMAPPGGPPGSTGDRGQSTVFVEAKAEVGAEVEAASAVASEDVAGPTTEPAVAPTPRSAIPAIAPNLPRTAMRGPSQ
ncbi:hypothetical protein ACFT9I_11135 [Streptomyces sp. NPDC057137]|uniref:hypothetical protein n=1 Tax=Streptomyces sp. NPDC057137 TaxID=3346030 RepID=UPI003626DA70